MAELTVCAVAWLVAIVGSEFVLAGRKVQTGLARAGWVFGTTGTLLLAWTQPRGMVGAPTLLLYWTGAFLTWFSVRSHVESSILLRLVYLLRDEGRRAPELLDRYDAHYGARQRLDELIRAGLAHRVDNGVRITPKGRFILKVAQFLR